ncbi:MAG TPA: hypothetical protein DCZ04_00065 [Syntrophorhabdus aromaticivorans]|jgi:hypothetical protein|nr:hypothetical protein [Syntrophorhabdus aromaticivorans]
MHEETRQALYGLFVQKGIKIETNEDMEYENFCCLRITQEPERGPTLIIGKFTDDTMEMLLLAHEYGHVLHYESLSKEEAEIAYCAIFASNHLGLENISPDSKRMVIAIEKKASEYAVTLLTQLTGDAAILEHARETYGNWINGYLKKAHLADEDAISP